MEVLFQDEHFIFVDKPSGFHVHQPEDPSHRARPDKVCLQVLKKQTGKYLYPLHRLDAATSGVLGFAFSKEATKAFLELHENKTLEKEYHALVRGFVADHGVIQLPLKSDSSEAMLAAETLFWKLDQFEIPEAIGKRHSVARYSLVKIKITTGRYHQIRRHFAQSGHPLIGDRAHGDSHHNRYFREQMQLPGLFLRASKLQFDHPLTQKNVTVLAPWNHMWLKLFDKFQIGAKNEEFKSN